MSSGNKAYLEYLKNEMDSKKKTKREIINEKLKEREENDRLSQYQPFGKGGSGAPIYDANGNILTKRKPIDDKSSFTNIGATIVRQNSAKEQEINAYMHQFNTQQFNPYNFQYNPYQVQINPYQQHINTNIPYQYSQLPQQSNPIQQQQMIPNFSQTTQIPQSNYYQQLN